jgi:hypothetical protein
MTYQHAIFFKIKQIVGIPGFEPGTPCSQSRYANRTALHPEKNLYILEKKAVKEGFEPSVQFPVRQFSKLVV